MTGSNFPSIADKIQGGISASFSSLLIQKKNTLIMTYFNESIYLFFCVSTDVGNWWLFCIDISLNLRKC